MRPLSVAHQIECLQAEGGKSGIAAAKAHHDELPGGAADQDPPIRAGQGPEKSYDEGSGHIDDERPPGKGFSEGARDQTGQEIARDGAQAPPAATARYMTMPTPPIA